MTSMAWITVLVIGQHNTQQENVGDSTKNELFNSSFTEWFIRRSFTLGKNRIAMDFDLYATRDEMESEMSNC